jgi:ABC-type transport system involved in cytochrome c biogenesis permease subunit
MVSAESAESLLVLAATGALVASMGAAAAGVRAAVVLGLLLVGVAMQTVALAARWSQLGHGPFTTMYEVLASTVWSLSLIYAVAYTAMPRIRATATLVIPFIVMLAAWMLSADASPGHLPPTFSTPLLYVHSIFGKLFLGTLMLSMGVAAVIPARRTVLAGRFVDMPDNDRLVELSYRLAALAFVFDTLMLIIGAVWAQDAWGRYWAWDPLETWAFLTWLALAFALHLKTWMRPRPLVWVVLVLLVFVLAFLTFFGVPFVSDSPHKGAF